MSAADASVENAAHSYLAMSRSSKGAPPLLPARSLPTLARGAERSADCCSYRWPVILTNVISTLSNSTHQLHSSSDSVSAEKLQEGKTIISQVSALKSQMGKNAVLE